MKKALGLFAGLVLSTCLLTIGIHPARADEAREPVSGQLRAAPPSKPRTPAQVHKFAAKEALTKFLAQNQAFPEKVVSQFGLAATASDPSTGDLWATVINDGRDAQDRGYAGFYTVTIENTSTVPWTASIKAGFDVTMVQGEVALRIDVYRGNTNFEGRLERVSSVGSHELVTSKFTLEPGNTYHAIVLVSCEPAAKDQAVSVKARIHDVKWNIEL